MKRVTLLMVLLTPAAFLAPSYSWALTYECADVSGKIIFTDSPSQLRNCTASQHGGEVVQSSSPRPPFSSGGGASAAPAPSPALSSQPVLPVGRGPGEGIAIPVTKVGRSLVVQARLNGIRDARLIVDTGAEITVLSHAAALDAGFLPSQSMATVTLNTAAGSVRADAFRLGSVSLGEAEARDVTAAVHDLSDAPAGVDGLLGLTFLDKFLVTLDAQKGELKLKSRP